MARKRGKKQKGIKYDAPWKMDRVKGNIEEENMGVGAAIYEFISEFMRKK